MTALATLLATGLSLAALAYLAATDAKRRRVFGLAPFEGQRRVWPALAATFLPGLALLFFGNSAGFVAWLGAVTVVGWGVAALPPAQATRLRLWTLDAAATARAFLADAPEHLSTAAAGLTRWLRAARGMPARIAALEARVASLEAELERLRARRDMPPPKAAPATGDRAPASYEGTALRSSI